MISSYKQECQAQNQGQGLAKPRPSRFEAISIPIIAAAAKQSKPSILSQLKRQPLQVQLLFKEWRPACVPNKRPSLGGLGMTLG